MKKAFKLAAIFLLFILVAISCGNKNNSNNDSTHVDSQNNVEEKEDIIVKINDDGTTNGNHVFASRDEKTFYLDYVGYEIVQSHIDVKAYDLAAIEGNVKIESKININNNTYEVLRIAENAFYGCQRMTSVSIPSSVRMIRESAFELCPNLTSVKFSDGLENIGKKAFSRCEKLLSIIIPSSVDYIGEMAFCSTRSLESIVVEKSNDVYDSRNDCNAIIESATNTLIQGCKATVIPDNIVKIGPDAFWYCKDLISIDIPNSVVSIGNGAFCRCEKLKSLQIPNSVTEIGRMAFSGCSNLESLNIPNSVDEIGSAAFEGCSKLVTISIPDKVSKIEAELFSGCTNLQTVKFGSGVESIIGDWVFEGCPNLNTIVVSSTTPPHVSYSAFLKMEVEPWDVELHVPKEAVEEYKKARYWKEFTIVGD